MYWELAPCKRAFFCQVSELDELMEEYELHAAGKKEGPIRLGGTEARRVGATDTFTGEKRKGRGPNLESSSVLSLCLDPNSCLKGNTLIKRTR